MEKKADKSESVVKNWTYDKAATTVPYVRGCLADIRVNIVLLLHLYRKHGHSRRACKNDPLVVKTKEEGTRLVGELDRLGVIRFQAAYRGIALYPFTVFYEDGTGRTPREAYYVYKDSRDGIESFVFRDMLECYGDLYAWEQPVPAAWKAGGEPVLNAYQDR